MLRRTDQLNLGVILCKHCNETIDTLDTDNVIIYYSDCNRATCQTQREVEGVAEHEQ